MPLLAKIDDRQMLPPPPEAPVSTFIGSVPSTALLLLLPRMCGIESSCPVLYICGGEGDNENAVGGGRRGGW